MNSSRLGAILGLLAAATFGVSAPLAKLLLAELSPQLLAGLLYLGAGIGLSLFRLVRPRTREAPLARSDLPPPSRSRASPCSACIVGALPSKMATICSCCSLLPPAFSRT